MNIGIPKEIKNNERRVSITPSIVAKLVKKGHQVFIQKDAGIGSGISNQDYISAGGQIVQSAKEAWSNEMVIKVKEPLKKEYKFFKKDLILFTFLHLAAEPELSNALLKSGVTGIAYETVRKDNALPLLKPMSQVAGKRSVTIGAHFLESHNQGKGILLGGVNGTHPGVVTILGGGIAGEAAAKNALGLGAIVNVLDINETRMKELDKILDHKANIIKSNTANLIKCIKETDLLISTILIPGSKSIKIVKTDMVKEMPKGGVIIDISIDQGGSVETIEKITTLDNPIVIKHGILHYSVANMPGATPISSTHGLTNATEEYIYALANKGLKAFKSKPELLGAVNTFNHHITCKPVADALKLNYKDINTLI